MNRYVGTEKMDPDSLMPRRLPMVMMTMKSRPMTTLRLRIWGAGLMMADASLVLPATARAEVTANEPGRDRDGHGHDVVDEQRRRRHQPRYLPQVALADVVRPAPIWIRMDYLAVAEGDEVSSSATARAMKKETLRALLPATTRTTRAASVA